MSGCIDQLDTHTDSTTRQKCASDLPAGLPAGISRRHMLLGSCSTVALAAAATHISGRRRESVFLARNQHYDRDLTATIHDGLIACGFAAEQVNGKRVLLKPNLVEPLREAPQISTNPTVVAATIEVFRNWGASVTVGEAPGHLRDTDLALLESGLQSVLDDTSTPFADLNYEESVWIENQGGVSPLEGFHIPATVATADLIVSLPKLKSHHWVGLTAAMKNLYGTLPGLKYGWPKNVLHYAGIPQTVYDINASLPKTITVVDGIVCMEGDGPIMGTAKEMGLIAVGTNLAATDATLARIMGLDPRRVPYLAIAADRLGPICPSKIVQQGEDWQSLVSPFRLIDYPHIQQLRDKSLAEKVT